MNARRNFHTAARSMTLPMLGASLLGVSPALLNRPVVARPTAVRPDLVAKRPRVDRPKRVLAPIAAPTPAPNALEDTRLVSAHEIGRQWGLLGMGLAFAGFPSGYDNDQRRAFGAGHVSGFRDSGVNAVSIEPTHPIVAILERLVAVLADDGPASETFLAAEDAAWRAIHFLDRPDDRGTDRPRSVRFNGRWFVALAVGRVADVRMKGRDRGVCATVVMPGMMVG